LEQLNPLCVRALDEARSLAAVLGHAEVGIEHWMLRLIEQEGGDVPYLLRAFRIDEAAVRNALLDGLEPQNAAAIQGEACISSAVAALTDEARRYGRTDLPGAPIRSGALLFALLSLRGHRLPAGLMALETIPIAVLDREFMQMLERPEEGTPLTRTASAPADGAASLAQRIGQKLDELAWRLMLAWRISVRHSEALCHALADECAAPDGDGPEIDRLIAQNLLPTISDELRRRRSCNALPAAIFLGAGASDGISIHYVEDARRVAAVLAALELQSQAQMAARLLDDAQAARARPIQ